MYSDAGNKNLGCSQQALNEFHQNQQILSPAEQLGGYPAEQLGHALAREKAAYARLAEVEEQADFKVRCACLDAAIRTPELLDTKGYIARAEAFYGLLKGSATGG